MNIIVILDLFGTIVLYSGINIIGKVHLGGILSSLTTSSSLSNSFVSSFPRRSSLLPTIPLTPDNRFDDELHLLSPVQPLQSNVISKSGQCIGLKNPAGNRLSLSYPGGKYFRFSIPVICENLLITNCLLSIREVLPKSLGMTVIIKWYGTRNAPGTQDFSLHQEWEMFQNFMFDLINRNWNSMRENSLSPSEEPIKRRKNDNSNGSNSDWNFMLSKTNKSYIYNSRSQGSRKTSDNKESLLFPYAPLIMFSFHLVYEEMKLSGPMRSSLELLGHVSIIKYSAHS